MNEIIEPSNYRFNEKVREKIRKHTKFLNEKVWKKQGKIGAINDTLIEYQRIFEKEHKL